MDLLQSEMYSEMSSKYIKIHRNRIPAANPEIFVICGICGVQMAKHWHVAVVMEIKFILGRLFGF